MKPKHTVYCHECGRNKILFETQKKADNFIKFNSDTIKQENGRKPVRSYYCVTCGGYHVTSKPQSKAYKYDNFSDKVISDYYKDIALDENDNNNKDK